MHHSSRPVNQMRQSRPHPCTCCTVPHTPSWFLGTSKSPYWIRSERTYTAGRQVAGPSDASDSSVATHPAEHLRRGISASASRIVLVLQGRRQSRQRHSQDRGSDHLRCRTRTSLEQRTCYRSHCTRRSRSRSRHAQRDLEEPAEPSRCAIRLVARQLSSRVGDGQIGHLCI